ncbi:3-dehydrosphinganine reductase, partial [Homalodisca vitripennis]
MADEDPELEVRRALDVVQSMIDISADRLEGLRTQCATSAELTQHEIRTLEKCRGKTGKYNKATHQLNGRRPSAITLSTRLLDFDLCLRMGR